MSNTGLQHPKPCDFSQWIPIFPLPNAVLMPRAIQPLHIFEERYRIMTRETLCGQGLIALALLKPGYEASYHTLKAPIHRVACVGRILREERLPDGRYNFLLQGQVRCWIREENTEKPYRRGHLEPLPSPPISREEDYARRSDLKGLLSEPPLVELAARASWSALFDCPDLCLSDLVDLLASAVLPCVEEKQKFLAEPSVALRAQRLTEALRTLAGQCIPVPSPEPCLRHWPPVLCEN